MRVSFWVFSCFSFYSNIFLSIPLTDLNLYIIAVAQSPSGCLGKAENKCIVLASCLWALAQGHLFPWGWRQWVLGDPWECLAARIWVTSISICEQKKVIECSGLNQMLSVLHWRNKRLMAAIQVTLMPLLTSPLKRAAALSLSGRVTTGLFYS